jgi:hypothetical protein
MNVLDRLVLRLKAINIEIELIGNYPWVYLYKVNGNAIKKEDYYLANHGFTISFMPMSEREKMEIIDIKKTFELIRKYR